MSERQIPRRKTPRPGGGNNVPSSLLSSLLVILLLDLFVATFLRAAFSLLLDLLPFLALPLLGRRRRLARADDRPLPLALLNVHLPLTLLPLDRGRTIHHRRWRLGTFPNPWLATRDGRRTTGRRRGSRGHLTLEERHAFLERPAGFDRGLRV